MVVQKAAPATTVTSIGEVPVPAIFVTAQSAPAHALNGQVDEQVTVPESVPASDAVPPVPEASGEPLSAVELVPPVPPLAEPPVAVLPPVEEPPDATAPSLREPPFPES